MYVRSLVLLLFVSQRGLASISIVTLSGGQNCRNCSTDGGDGTHANPGDMISINCAIDNPDNLVNSLVWSISSFGVSITNTDGNDADDVDQSDFVSTVNDFNDTLSTTNATLTFPAISDLDEAVVKCRGAQTDTAKECTLCIKTPPSEPLNLNSTARYNSCELKWNTPSDNGGGDESITAYNIIGTPDDINSDPSTTMDTILDLTPNTAYMFNVSARNSLGLGDPASVQCNTTGNIPPGFVDVSVCLDVNMAIETELDIYYTPCPIVITDTDNTPPVDNYTVNITGLLLMNITRDTCDYNIPVSEDNIYTVEMSVNNIIGRNITTAPPFITSWLRDIEVKETISTSTVIQYTTADCVIPKNLIIELNIDVNYSNINPSSIVSYESSTTDQFTVLGLEPNVVVTYTIQVIAEASDMFVSIGMSRTGSFTVMSTTSTMTSSTTSTSSNAMSDSTIIISMSSMSSPTIAPISDDEFPIAPVIGGVIGGVVIILLIIIIITIIIILVWYRNKKHSGKDPLLKSRDEFVMDSRMSPKPDTTVSSPFVVNTSSQLVENTPVSDISSQTSTINKESLPTGHRHTSQTTKLSSPYDVLRRHTSEILNVIPQPEKLANDLSSVCLISAHFADDVLTNQCQSRYLKSSKLLTEIQRSLKVFNDEEKFKLFCNVLKQQNHSPLSKICNTMLKEL